MKSGKIGKGFTVSAIALALCATLSTASTQQITMGNAPLADLPLNFLSMTPGVANDPNNPNLFPVYFAESAIGQFGFLLDDSEAAKTLTKRFEDAHANGTNVTLYYEDLTTLGFKVGHTLWGTSNPGVAFKIVYISTAKR